MKTLPLNTLDYAVVLSYFAIIFIVGALILYREGRNKMGGNSASYFLGGRNMGWFVIGASLFASNIGSEHLVGLAGAGASGEFPVAHIEITAAFMLLLLGWLFVPFYLRSKVFTMPEFLELRYDSWARGYLSWVSIVAYVITKITITLLAGGIVLTALTGVDFWTGVLVIVAITGIYTILGGLKIVIYTDMIQLFVLVGGAIAVTYYGLIEVGGWSEVVARTDIGYTSLWRSMKDESFPWTGVLFGAPILGVWYWCTDQFIVQRVLSARNLSEARKGTIFAGFLKLLPLFIFIIPGVIAFALSLGNNPAIEFPIINGEVSYDAALPMLTLTVLPSGFKGLVVAGLIAALMSSLSSVFNSCSTLFTIDIYQKYFPETSQKKLVQIGRIATIVMIVCALLFIPILQNLRGGIFEKLQSLQAYIAPPVASIFLFGVLTKRVNSKGAKYALLVGALLGLCRLILEILELNIGGVWGQFAEMNFLHFAIFLFVLSSAVLLVVSHYTKVPWKDEINDVTIQSLRSLRGSKWNVLLSIVLIVLILIIWYVFS